jgi:hypothetical chaperone protein
MTTRSIGLDFGTTNSSLALYDDAAQSLRIARFRASGGSTTEAYRSVLYFEPPVKGPRGKKQAHAFAGPLAIEQYLESENKGRLIQSIKSFATSRVFSATNVFGRLYSFEELVALIVKRLLEEAEEQFGPIRDLPVTVGRPVRFAGAAKEADETFALDRIRKALSIAGLDNVRFEYEPVGAAYHYASRLTDHSELVLIGDFGGGTSDFSLLQIDARQKTILGNEGVGLAGDSFDASIIRHLVSPRLGEGTEYRSMDKLLPVPTWVYSKLERWHHLSFLKAPETLQMLSSVKTMALEPDRIAGLIFLIENDLGYQLHKAVQETKISLSREALSTFHFVDGDVDIVAKVKRTLFEAWIAAHLRAITASVDRLLESTGVKAAEVDRVFLTGGSSFVPAVRAIFAEKFGHHKLSDGDEFTSVANGLALRGADQNPSAAAAPMAFVNAPDL